MVVVVVVVVMIGWMSVRTYQRNPEWASDLQLFRTAVETCPQSAKAQMLYGQELQVQGRWAECIPHLQAALAIEPDYCETSYSLGVAEYRTGLITQGLTHIKSGIACNFTTEGALLSLFPMYDQLLQVFGTQGHPIIYTGYAALLHKVNRVPDAINLLLMLHSRFNATEQGVRYLEEACSYAPAHCHLAYTTGTAVSALPNALHSPFLLLRAFTWLERASWKHNCSDTHLHALDAMVPLIQRLVQLDPTSYSSLYSHFSRRATRALNDYHINTKSTLN